MGLGDISLIVKSAVAETLTNISSSNPNIPSQHVKKEGWTETFGNLEASESAKARKEIKAKAETSILNSSNKKNNSDPNDIQIIQYRMEWGSQLFLRIHNIPHTVVNTPYVSNQTTGAYPQYRNLPQQIMIGNDEILPHLMDICNDGNVNVNVNGDGDDKGSSGIISSADADTMCAISLIEELKLILNSLKFGDYRAWEDIYKNQCIHASTLHGMEHDNQYNYDMSGASSSSSGSGFKFHGLARFQAWAERSIHLKRAKVGNATRHLHLRSNSNNGKDANYQHQHCSIWDEASGKFNKTAAIALASERYAALDAKLEHGHGSMTLVGAASNTTATSTSTSTTNTELSLSSADIMLFAHLAEALCDLNLVTVLAECQNLVLFFQTVYERYFGKAYQAARIQEQQQSSRLSSSTAASAPESSSSSTPSSFAWIRANNEKNAMNQFNRIPMNESSVIRKVSVGGGGTIGNYQDAIKIMQSVAMHCHDLQEVLADMSLQTKGERAKFASESNPEGKEVGWLFHKWRMGGDFEADKKKKKKSDGSDGDYDGNDDDADGTDPGTSKKYTQQMKKLLREAKKNDELWISGVICASVIGLISVVGVETVDGDVDDR